MENEPKIEYEPNPEKRESKLEIPEAERKKEESKERVAESKSDKEIERKKEEVKEKKEAHKEEVEELVSMAKEKGFSKALKRAKKNK